MTKTDTKASKTVTEQRPVPVSLSIVVPVYNEVPRLPLTFEALLADVDWGIFALREVIFVNDGSTDKTVAVIKNHRAQLEKKTGAQVKIISYTPNRGKGYAIRTGMLAATGDYILMMDADMSTPLSELKRLQSGVRRRRPIIIGTRKSRVVRVEKEQPWIRVFMGRVYTQLAQSFLNTYVSDFTCGFKLFRYDVAQKIFGRSRIERWSYDAEIMFLSVRLGFRPLEVAVRWHNDERSRVNVVRDASRSFVDLLSIRAHQLLGHYQLPQGIGFGNRKNRSSENGD